MSIAFPALVITLLFLPGILFYYNYKRGFLPQSIIIQDEIVRGVLVSLPINFLAIGIINNLAFPDIDFKVIVVILTGWLDEENALQYINAISDNAELILLYVIVINALSAFTGYLFYTVVRYYRLDLRFDALRIPNKEWHYWLSGGDFVMNTLKEEKESEALIKREEEQKKTKQNAKAKRQKEQKSKDKTRSKQTDTGDEASEAKTIYKPIVIRKWQITAAEIKAKEAEIDLHVVAAVIEQGSHAYIYRGVLDQYFLDKKGGLERIVIRYPQRRKLEKDPSIINADGEAYFEGSFSDIDGHYFVIEYSRILNLNLYYYHLAETSDS